MENRIKELEADIEDYSKSFDILNKEIMCCLPKGTDVTPYHKLSMHLNESWTKKSKEISKIKKWIKTKKFFASKSSTVNNVSKDKIE